MKTKSAVTLFALVVATCILSACNFMRGYATGRSTTMTELEQRQLSADELGIARFVFDDFGGLDTDTLETNALPWKLATTALVLAREPHAVPTTQAVQAALSEFGFIYPESVVNWPLSEQPRFDRPLGLVSGLISRQMPKIQLDAMNTGCAACHAGVTYDASGQPTRRVWIGLPNTSLNIDGYVDAVYRALKMVRGDPEHLLSAMTQLYPETTEIELRTIRRFVWPRLTARFAELEAHGDQALPFKNGGPGVTNGVAALKLRLGVADTNVAYAGTTSIPELGYRYLRSSLLYDGVYTNRHADRFKSRTISSQRNPEALAGIVGFFTVPTMGMQPDHAITSIPHVADAMRFLETYQSPQFPGKVNATLAQAGRSIYDARCAACHGSYDANVQHPKLLEFPNRLVPQEQLGTDATRWQVIDTELLTGIEHSAIAKYIDANNTGGYVAPLLSGLWATAPYLHNGSVPTLWQLMHPDARPKQFLVGGHALDFMQVGIAGTLNSEGVWVYPTGYIPWSKPVLFDTADPGRSNKGHEREFTALTEVENASLLEFLKLL
jgi:mono/diheme cytochrome c family protein